MRRRESGLTQVNHILILGRYWDLISMINQDFQEIIKVLALGHPGFSRLRVGRVQKRAEVSLSFLGLSDSLFIVGWWTVVGR